MSMNRMVASQAASELKAAWGVSATLRARNTRTPTYAGSTGVAGCTVVSFSQGVAFDGRGICRPILDVLARRSKDSHGVY